MSENLRKTSFTVIAREAQERFGEAPSMLQVRLWWFGQTRGGMTPERQAHRRHVEREVGPWEVVIRLALRYANNAFKECRDPNFIYRNVYTLIWSDFKTTVKAKNKKGEEFMGRTWWMYAVEHRYQLEPTVGKRSTQNMQAGLNEFVRQMQKKIGIFLLLLLPVTVHGADVICTWQPNMETDLRGYKVYYGIESRNYEHIVFVDRLFQHCEVSGLTAGRRYYFTVTAIDWAGNESEFSDEVNIVLRADLKYKVDLNGDGRESAADLVQFLLNYQRQDSTQYIYMDYNQSGHVSLADYTQLLIYLQEAIHAN